MASAPSLGALLVLNRPWATIRQLAQQAEQTGLDTLWVDDHLANPVRPDETWLDAWTTLAGIAAETERIGIGPLVSNTLLRHPAVLLRQLVTVESIADGRVNLGLGAGYAPFDRAVSTRGDGRPTFPEVVSIIDHALRTDTITLSTPEGEDRTHALRPVSLQQPRPALTVAGVGRTSLAAAVRHADAWVTYGGAGLSGTEHLRVVASQLDQVAVECARQGRARSSLRTVLLTGRPEVCDVPLWSSRDRFGQHLSAYRELGVDDFVLYWPPDRYWDDAPGISEVPEFLDIARRGPPLSAPVDR